MADNYSLVEGLWGNFTFHRVRSEDSDKVVEHVNKYFLRDEPTSKLVGYTDEYGQEFGALVRKVILEGLSFWVEDNNTSEVAAVRLTFRHKKEENLDGIVRKSGPLRALRRVVGLCHKACDPFEYYNVKEFANFFVASTATKFRNQGIASELYKRSFAFLAAEGFVMVKSVFTSPFSRSAALKLGFEELYRLDYKDAIDTNGTPVFAQCKLTEEHYGALMCKKL